MNCGAFLPCHVSQKKSKPTAVGRLLTADARVRSRIESINNPVLSLRLRHWNPFNSLWLPLQPEVQESRMSREQQTSSMTIFGYKGVKRANRAGSAEKPQQKASCALLGRAKTARRRSVTQGKAKSRDLPDTGRNRWQKQMNRGHCMESMRFKVTQVCHKCTSMRKKRSWPWRQGLAVDLRWKKMSLRVDEILLMPEENYYCFRKSLALEHGLLRSLSREWETLPI